MSKHTPGPFRWNRLDSGSIALESDVALHRVATVHRNENTEANARLIAAAPEMLEALKSIRQSLIDMDAARQTSHALELGKLDYIIAKVEGNEK